MSTLKNTFLVTLVASMCLACQKKESSQGENFLSQVDQVQGQIVDDSDMINFFRNERNPIQPAFQMLPTGSNRPTGWLHAIMKNDLEKGMVGALDELYPAFGVDDIYYKNRRGGLDDVPEMGDIVLTGAAWEQSIMWWNAETFGNWWDGFVRHAFLIGDEEAIAQSTKIIENLLASQDEDGYIGIYKDNLRYQHEGSNGELWAQTTVFRTMLGYYEITGDKRVKNAVEKAMAVTMKEYNEGGRNPFLLKNAFGGVTHGLMMTDVCETLFRITGKQVYQDYATYLYEAYSRYSINRAFTDLRYPDLVERDTLFLGHGVHTYEHFRSMIQSYYATGYPEMKQAYENALYKLDFTLLPSGAGHAMEWIAKMIADPDKTATEFCTMLELRNSFGSMVQKTGEVVFADRAERLTFNGIMGFRNQEGTALTYGKADNCYILNGQAEGPKGLHKEPRFKYSPTHSDPAVCCVPNYSRNYSYYLDMMWMKKDNGLAAVMYGPSRLKTRMNDTDVTLEQVTNYPFSDDIRINVQTSEPAEFPMYFRKPGWAKSMRITGVKNQALENGFYKVSKTWVTGDVIEIKFEYEMERTPATNDEVYYQRGPLVFAYPIRSKREVIKEYDKEGFTDYYVLPEDEDYKALAFQKKQSFTFVLNEVSEPGDTWKENTALLKGKMINTKTNQPIEVQLIPMGSTTLRKVTFPIL